MSTPVVGVAPVAKRRLPMQKILPFASLIVLFIGLAVASPHFMTRTNLSSVVRQTAVINIMALGMTIIIISGGIDLSVGAILAMGGLLGTMAMAKGMPIAVGVGIGILTGLGCGLLNGILIAQLKIAPFIVTLGTLGIFRGVTLIVSNGLPVHEIPQSFAFLGEGNLLYVPFVLWLLLLCAGAMHFLLDHTKLGRYSFAIGSNPAAAIYAGIPVNAYTIAVYAIGGMLTGLSGMIEASRLMTGQPTAGQGYELQAIAAVVIGGGSLTGGEGSVMGTLIGAVIILAVSVDELRKRRGA